MSWLTTAEVARPPHVAATIAPRALKDQAPRYIERHILTTRGPRMPTSTISSH